ncbi:hypothetical protein O3M35_008748 [Rhynocoris fuscipes]|uniref:Uncharacterized protein n=1 Tax=Rhynocoris fuscipes TaxID=488301 RepID=A0AAW1DCL3_9HEMI
MMDTKFANLGFSVGNTILDFTLFIHLLTLVRSQLNNFDGSLNAGNPGPLLNFPSYVPTVGPSFPAITPAFPVQLPVYFLENHGEIPNKRFGFNVIYRSPNDPNSQPNYYSETKRNVNYSLPENNNGNSEPTNRYNDKPSSESKGVHYRTKETKNPLLTLYDDWSPDEYERSRKKGSEKIPSNHNNYKIYGTEETPTHNKRKSYPRYTPQSRSSKNSGNHRLQPQYRSYPSKRRSNSLQQFYRTNSYPRRAYGKSQNREITRNHPQRKVLNISKKPFRPSPPDVYLNSQSPYSDYSTDGSSNQPRVLQINNLNFTDEVKKQTCIRTNKTVDRINNGQSNIKFCYACVDKETGTRYEECSLGNAYNFEKFNGSNSKLMGELRNKRETEDKSRNKRQDDYYDGSGTPHDRHYRFGPEAFVDDEPSNDGEEVSYESDDPNERCWKKKSGDMLCISCESTYSGGTYEQCSYATDPHKVSYDHSVSNEYGTSRSLEDDNKSYYPETESDHPIDLPPSSPPTYSSPFIPHPGRESNPYYPPLNSYPHTPISPPHQVSSHGRQDYRPPGLLPFIPRPPNYNVPQNTFPSFGDHFVPYGLSTINNYGKPYNSFDNTFPNIFPELSDNSDPLHEFNSDEDDDFSASFEEEDDKKFSKRNNPKVRRNPLPEPINKRNDKTEIKRTIDEFSHRNRTACKKLLKNKMTCYQCLDENGMKYEDCLHVGSLPSKSNKISYHKMSEYKSSPNYVKPVPQRVTNMPSVRFVNTREKINPPETTIRNNTITFRGNMYNPTIMNAGIRRSRSSDNKDNVAISNNNITEINTTGIQDQLGKESIISYHNTTNNETNEEDSSEENEEDEEETTSEKYNSIPTDPPELQIPNPDGQFSEDTLMMFDPLLGISLPKYMLEKSEHEAVFDEILASG